MNISQLGRVLFSGFTHVNSGLRLGCAHKTPYFAARYFSVSTPPSDFSKDGRRALELIFGSRTRKEFTPEEKAIVDEYVSSFESECGPTLPNTCGHEEQKAIQAQIEAQPRSKR